MGVSLGGSVFILLLLLIGELAAETDLTNPLVLFLLNNNLLELVLREDNFLILADCTVSGNSYLIKCWVIKSEILYKLSL